MIRNILTITIIALFLQNAKGQCNRAADSLALVEFYLNTGGPNWADNTNWLVPGKAINTWKGVLVNSNNCVWFLSLGSNNLVGSLDVGLHKLKGLEYLNLFDNQLIGEIPKSIESLSQLSTFTLSSNKFTGQLPPEIRLLNQLKNLSLDNNLLSGPIPTSLFELSNLQTLNLSRNNFSGILSNEITALSDLEFFDVGYNNFVGAIPDDLGTLSNLKSLDLSNNGFSGSIPSNLRFLVNLEDLWLQSNRFSGHIDSFIGDFGNLKVLNLAGNDFSGEVNVDLDKFEQMQYLDLSHNNFTGILPRNVNKLANIIRPIDFSNNQFVSPIPMDLIQSKGIFIDNNNFTFKDILKYDSLNPGSAFFYYSRQNQFYTDTILNAIAGQDFIIDLEIDSLIPDNEYKWRKNGNQNWVPNVINNPNSNKLIFPSVSLSDVATYDARVTNSNFSSVVRLQSSNIGLRVCNRLNDSLELVKLFTGTSGSTWINNLNWLNVDIPIQSWYGIVVDENGCVNKIDLSNNNLQNQLPILDLNTLDTLILRTNNLTGPIPNLKIPFIKYLDLSENAFTSNLPIILSTWMKLVNLNLSSNNLSGIIPPDIGDLCDLEELRLNNNNFIEELPVELTHLQNLKIGFVDFSNNNIDSLKQKIAFFCPFGDNILSSNPSYDRFLGICNIACAGSEWDSLNIYTWIKDSILSLEMKYCNSGLCRLDMGYANVRNVKVIYTRITCFDNSNSDMYTVITKFYDCGGNVLESIILDSDGTFTSSGAILYDEYIALNFDIRRACGSNFDKSTNVNEIFDESKSSFFSIYPNPTLGLLKFKFQEDMKIQTMTMYDVNGRQLKFNFVLENGEVNITIYDQYKGLGIVKIAGKSTVYLAKVLII